MLQKGNSTRTLTAMAVFVAQQATGATAFAYFGPQYFKLLVGNKRNSDLLLTAIFGAIKVGACALFVIFVADNVPRKAILTAGAVFMAACQISTAAVVKTHPANEDGSVTSSGIATVALIYLFVIAYNFSWGPLPWPYVAEVRICWIYVAFRDMWLTYAVDLSNSHARARCSNWRGQPVAVQLRLLLNDALYDQEHGLGHLLALGLVRSHHCIL